MSNFTQNFALKKPLDSEYFDINDINGNMDVIDQKLKENANAIAGKADGSHNHDSIYISKNLVEMPNGICSLDEKVSVPLHLMAQNLPKTLNYAGSNLGSTSGTSTAYNLNYSYKYTSYIKGMIITFIPHVTCGDNPTINIDNLGPKSLLKRNHGTYSAGELTANGVYLFIYDGESLRETAPRDYSIDYPRCPSFLDSGGSANTYIASIPTSSFSAYVDGMVVNVRICATNTGACTLNLNSLGARAIKDAAGNSLASGILVTNNIYSFIYDGSINTFRLLNYIPSNASSYTLPNATSTTFGGVKVPQTAGIPLVPVRGAQAAEMRMCRGVNAPASWTPTTSNNCMVMLNLRVVTSTSVKAYIMFSDMGGTNREIVIVNSTLSAGNYMYQPQFFYPNSTVNVVVDVGSDNSVYASCTILSL